MKFVLHKFVNILRYGIVAAFLNLFGIGCDSDRLEKSINYFPLRVGQTWIYEIEETSITLAACTDDGVTSTRYQLLVEVVDSVSSADQGFTYRFKRSKRSKATDQWLDFETWTAQLIGNRLVVSEGNVSYVKLLTPMTSNLVWNGNLYNNRQELNGKSEDDYKGTLVSQPYVIGLSGLSFANTVSVVQNDEQSNIIYRDSRLEVYADQVGLIYKESYLLNYFANSQLPCFAQKQIQQGFIYKQSLKEFSK
ncbi:MAG: hypothetical protein ORN54_09240 [Cyclobacteriaceae bacterium]|nr:hypothetical protein [Cyclobacteriaceae bacterium]